MGQKSPISAVWPEFPDSEDPRQTFARLQKEFEAYRTAGTPVPEELKRQHRQIVSECAALSQGR
ncbi:MAG: hypothetical protein ACOYLQ_08165 [Hyphomicrobiaceae bacterium]